MKLFGYLDDVWNIMFNLTMKFVLMFPAWLQLVVSLLLILFVLWIAFFLIKVLRTGRTDWQ